MLDEKDDLDLVWGRLGRLTKVVSRQQKDTTETRSGEFIGEVGKDDAVEDQGRTV